MENKNTELYKEKKIYTIELIVFCVIFLVLGILILVDVIPIKGTFRHILIYVSLAGVAWLIADWVWTLISPKRRKKQSLFDKFLVLPSAISVLVFDIITFVQGFDETEQLHETFVGILFVYIAVVYLAMAIYHWFKPHPLLLEMSSDEPEKTDQEIEKEGDDLKNLFASDEKKEEKEIEEKTENIE